MRVVFYSLVALALLAGIGYALWQFNDEIVSGSAQRGAYPSSTSWLIEFDPCDSIGLSSVITTYKDLGGVDDELLAKSIDVIADSVAGRPLRLVMSSDFQWLLMNPGSNGKSADQLLGQLDGCESTNLKDSYKGSYVTTSCGVGVSSDHNQLVLGTWMDGLIAVVQNNDDQLGFREWNRLKPGELEIVRCQDDLDDPVLSMFGVDMSNFNSKDYRLTTTNGKVLSTRIEQSDKISTDQATNPQSLWEVVPDDVDSLLCITTGFSSGIANLSNESEAQRQSDIADFEVACTCDVSALAIDEVELISLFTSGGEQFCIIQNAVVRSNFEGILEAIVTDFDQYKAYPLLTSELGTLYSDLLGIDKLNELGVFTVVGDFMVFAPDRESLSRYINKVASEKVFGASVDLQAYVRSLHSNPNLVGYWKEAPALEGIAKATFAGQNEPLMVQLSSIDGGYVQEVFMHSKGSQDARPSVNWEFFADQKASARPWALRNHRTGGKDILIQDENNTLYQLDASGYLSWKKELPAKILGAPKQVDLFKNGKLQIIFSTENSIYAFDRNGGAIGGFPINLEGKATTAIKVFDYDSNRDYRFLIGTESGEILNFNSSGKAQKGWVFEGSSGAIVGLEHIRIKKKDYILALNDNGDIHLLKRNGKSRYEAETTAEHYGGKGYYLMAGKTIGESKLIYPDSLGNVVIVQLNQPVNQFGLTGFSSGSILKFQDFDGDDQEDYVIVDGDEIKIYDQNNQRLLRFEAPSPIIGEPSIYNFGGGRRMVGFSTVNDEMFLLDKEALVVQGFPKKGSTQYLISDLDKDGNFEAVVCTSYGSVINYPLGKMR